MKASIILAFSIRSFYRREMWSLTGAVLFLGLWLATAQAFAAEQYYDGAGKIIDTTSSPANVATSPDGSMLAVVRNEGMTDQQEEKNSLWICTKADHICRIMLKPVEAEDPKRNLIGIEHPIFSLKGNFLYVLSAAWATSGAIHQVNVTTGQEKYVADANSLKIILNGRYSGDLLVEQHRYHSNPDAGSYDPVSVIDPGGKVLLQVAGDDGDPALNKWLTANRIELR